MSQQSSVHKSQNIPSFHQLKSYREQSFFSLSSGDYDHQHNGNSCDIENSNEEENNTVDHKHKCIENESKNCNEINQGSRPFHSLNRQQYLYIMSCLDAQTDSYYTLSSEIAKTLIPMGIISFGFQVPSILDYKWAGIIDNTDGTATNTAAYGLASLVYNTTGACFANLNVGLETLIAQAYGQHNYKRITTLTVVSLAILAVVIPFVSVLWASSQCWLQSLALNEAESNKVYVFLMLSIPSLFFWSVNRVNASLFLTIKLMQPLVASCVLNSFLYPFYSYYSVQAFGFNGLAFNYTIGYALITILNMLLAVCYQKIRDVLVFDQLENIFNRTNVCEILKYGIPSILMLLLNLISLQKSQIILSLVEQDEEVQDAHLIMLNVVTSLQVVGVGLYTAGAFPIGRNFGAGTYENARKITQTTVMFAAVLSILLAVCLWLGRAGVAEFYSSNEVIQWYVSSNMWAVAGVCIFSLIQTGLNGVFVATGNQIHVVFANLLFNYILGIPLDFLLTHKWGLPGLWLSIVSAYFCRLIYQSLVYTYKFNFLHICIFSIYNAMDKESVTTTNFTNNNQIKDNRTD